MPDLEDIEVPLIFECRMCGQMIEEPGFCSDECLAEYRYMYRTCDTCGGEFWDGGTSCTCQRDEDPWVDPVYPE